MLVSGTSPHTSFFQHIQYLIGYIYIYINKNAQIFFISVSVRASSRAPRKLIPR